MRTHQNNIGNYFGPYIRVIRVRSSASYYAMSCESLYRSFSFFLSRSTQYEPPNLFLLGIGGLKLMPERVFFLGGGQGGQTGLQGRVSLG